MKRIAILFGALCFFAIGYPRVAAAQNVTSVAGNWTVTAKLPDGTVTEQWTIQQNGDNVTGSVKKAGGQLPVTGTFDKTGGFLRVDVKDGDKTYKVRATTIDGETMDGSITVGVGKEYIWSAKRMK